jgi:hypothetical protein
MKLLILLVTACYLLPDVASLAQRAVPKHITNQRDVTRRDWLVSSVAAAAVPFLLPSSAAADEPAALTVQGLLNDLRSVPTFCIVNPEGATFMMAKGGETYAKGYAFTTFSGALAVLGDAQRAAEEGGYADLWKDASITVIPADIAVRLAIQPSKRTSQKDTSQESLLDVIPGVDEREVAIHLDRKFSDQGKVPLFYFEDLQLPGGSTPLFFNKNDLSAEWNRKNEGKKPPKAKVLDLLTIFQYVLRGRAGELPIRSVVFVPSPEAVEVWDELKSRGLAPYKVDRMVI